MEITPIVLVEPNVIPQVDIPAKTTLSENIFADYVSSLNSNLNSVEDMSSAVALGENISTHELVIAFEKAQLQLQFAIQVRNKLLESYQEIMRMQL